MILHPHVQKRAQEEIDMVIGSGRLPNLNDRTQGSLPYVEAIMNEVLRWHNVTPFSE
jgi:cytochrome P450